MEQEAQSTSTARQRLLEAAAELFYEQGVRATGVDAVVEMAGVSKATLYAHFPSKDDLVVAYLQELYRRWEDVLAKHSAEARTPTQQLHAVFAALAAWFDGAGHRGCPSVTTVMEFPDADHAVRQAATEVQLAYRGYFADIAERAGSPTPTQDADRLLTLFDGATVAAVATGSGEPIAQARDMAAELASRWPQEPS